MPVLGSEVVIHKHSNSSICTQTFCMIVYSCISEKYSTFNRGQRQQKCLLICEYCLPGDIGRGRVGRNGQEQSRSIAEIRPVGGNLTPCSPLRKQRGGT